MYEFYEFDNELWNELMMYRYNTETVTKKGDSAKNNGEVFQDV